jgi:hypothetical protein
MEESLEEALRLKAKELRSALEDLKKQDFSVNVEKLKSNLPKRKRCIICTLKLPCKHFKAVKDMPRASADYSLLNKSQEDFDLSSYNPVNEPESKKVSFMVQIRGRERKIVIDPDVRTTSLPNEKRFNLLCTIEAYREEKLKEEVRKLEAAKRDEQEKLKISQKAENNKQKYLSKQKEKLVIYREELKGRREELRNLLEMEKKKKEEKEEKLKKYYEKQKKNLEDDKKKLHNSIVVSEDGLAITV